LKAKRQSPADVQRDVASAANSAAEKNTQASEKQTDVSASVNKDLSEATQTADTKLISADLPLFQMEPQFHLGHP
jgi:hypothetical protein